MKVIPLTQGKVALIDDADYWLARQFKWCAWWSGWSWYAMAHPRRGFRISLHRLLAGFPPFKLDHKNRDGLDNRRENLRPATDSQNQANRARNKNNPSGFKGVRWKRDHQKWQARIRTAGKEFHIGYFRLAEEAATAYMLTALEVHGEYARAA